MTAGELARSIILGREFGPSIVSNTVIQLKKQWPSFPGGREKVTEVEVALVVYLLSSTENLRDIKIPEIDIIVRRAFELKADQSNPINELGRLIKDPTNLKRVEISTRTGWIELHYETGQSKAIPDDDQVKEWHTYLRNKTRELGKRVVRLLDALQLEVMTDQIREQIKEDEAMIEQIQQVDQKERKFFFGEKYFTVDFKTVLNKEFFVDLGREMEGEKGMLEELLKA